MSYGGAFDNSPKLGVADLNNNNKSSGQQIQGAGDQPMNFVDESSLSFDIAMAKLEQEIATKELEYKLLEKETEREQELYNETMRKIIDSEREKQEIISESEILDEIFENTKHMGIYNNPMAIGSERYNLSEHPDTRLGLIKTSRDYDAFEVQQMYAKSREHDGNIIYNKKRMSDLKKVLETKREQYKSGQDITPLGEDISTWS